MPPRGKKQSQQAKAAADRARKAQKKATETDEESQCRRQNNAECKRRKRAAEGEGEGELHRAVDAQRKRVVRQKEDHEQVDARRQAHSELMREVRQQEEPDHADARRQGNAAHMRQVRQQEEPDHADARRQGNADHMRQVWQREEPDHADARRQGNADHMRQVRQEEEMQDTVMRRAREAARYILRRRRPVVDVPQNDREGTRPRLNAAIVPEEIFESKMEAMHWVTCERCKRKVCRFDGNCSGKRCADFSVGNNMDPGPVPPQLQGLSFIEQQLIARIHPVICVYKIMGHQLGYSGNVINFPQAVRDLAIRLPHRVSDLQSVVAVRAHGDMADGYVDFHVRSDKVRQALIWLKENNEFYSDIEISEDNLALIPEDGNLFMHVSGYDILSDGTPGSGTAEYGEISTAQVRPGNDIEGASDVESEVAITITGVPMLQPPDQHDQIQTVLDWPVIGNIPIDEFQTPGYIVQAFPALYPTGQADLRCIREKKINPAEYFQHLMSYHDGRFARDPRFRFFALNSTMRWKALSAGKIFIQRNYQFRNMTAAGLREAWRENPNLDKQIMFYGSKLRGTRAYWRSRCGELLDLVEQMDRLPTLFFTLSAADLHWPDLFRLLQVAEGEDGAHADVSDRRRRELVADNPLIADTFFYERAELFVHKILPMIFPVTDFWYRYEYQHRGSPHLHGLLWLEGAPEVRNLRNATGEEKDAVVAYFDRLVSTTHPDPDALPAPTHSCRRRFREVENVAKDLAELLNKVQCHTKCSDYCLRTNKRTQQMECRFGFPHALREFSELLENENGTFDLATARNHPLLNKFNERILQFWGADIDVTPIISQDAILNYIVKYASKAEPRSESLREMIENILEELGDGADARKAIQRILIRSLAERDISAQEVCHLLMGYSLYSVSRKFVVLNLKEQNEWIELTQETDEARDGETAEGDSNFIVKYRRRPRNMENLSLWQVAKSLLPIARRWGNNKREAIVRVFPRVKRRADETENEGYYRIQVLLHVPWRSEELVKEGRATWKELFDGYNVQVQNPVELPDAEEEEHEDATEEPAHEQVRDEWMAVFRMGPGEQAERTELGRRELDVAYDW